MPQINRVRIINFSYNGDKRQILDESFNFHGGENALLNMKNGGGKSVLVQVMMQPVIPLVSLQMRKIKDFFVKKKLPAYVLVEWKLDDRGGYLLTGIALSNRESSGLENEETENNLKYFTFTNSYHLADAMDIMNIPLILKDDKRLIIKTYKEAQELILLESRGKNSHVEYFGQDDANHYKETLLSYNISQDEWRNIIRSINSDEGGVINIFEKCKTSHQLMREWILKTVDKVVYEDKKDAQKLDEMLERLAETMIENEQFILEKELLMSFLTGIEEYGNKVSELYERYSDKQDAVGQLCSLHQHLQVQNEILKKQIEAGREKIEDLSSNLKLIELEEKSKGYYDALENHREEKKLLEELTTRLTMSRENLEAKLKAFKIQKAAETMEKIDAFQAQLKGTEESLKRSASDDNDKVMIEKLSYSLKCAYEKSIMMLQEEFKHSGLELEEVRLKKEQERYSSIELEKRLKGLGHLEIDLAKKTAVFEKEEESLFKHLGFELRRNLLGKLADQEKEKAKKNLGGILADDEKELESQKQSYKEKEETIRDVRQKIQDIKLKKQELKTSLHVNNMQHEEYLNHENSLRMILKQYEIDFEKRFRSDYMSIEIRNIITSYEEIQDKNKQQARSLKKRMDAIDSGTLHVSEEYRDYLLRNEIQFNTGDNYLQSFASDKRDELLKKIPILPYSFIMTEQELEKVKYRIPEVPILQPVPIITYDGLDGKMDGSDYLVSFGQGTSIFCLFDRNMFDGTGFLTYRTTIEKELEEKKENIRHYGKVLEETREHQEIIKRFTYKNSTRYDLEKEIKIMEDLLGEISEKEVELISLMTVSEERIKELRLVVHETENKVSQSSANIRGFAQYLSGNDEYEILKDEEIEVKADKNTAEEKISLLKTRIEELKDEEYQKTDALRNVKQKLDLLYREAMEYNEAEEKEVLEGNLSELKEMLGAYRRDIERNLTELNNRKDYLIHEMNSKRAEIIELELDEKDYKGIHYDAQLKRKLGDEEKALRVDVNNLGEKSIDQRVKVAGLEEKMNSTLSRVRELSPEPLPKEEIKSDFSRRKAQNAHEIKVQQDRMRDVATQIKQFEVLMFDVSRQIPDEEIAGEIKKYVYKEDLESEFRALKARLSSLTKTCKEKEEEIQILLTRLRSTFNAKNSNVSTILYGLEKQAEQARQDKLKYYYLYEYTMNQREQLQKVIHLHELRLEKMEESFRDVVMQSYLHAEDIYKQILKVAEDSSIHLSGRNRPVKMIEIELPEPEEKDKCISKMRMYINERTNDVSAALKEGKKKEDVRKVISNFMSSWELLNVISDLAKLKVKAFKIDINAKNSHLKEWEKVMKENSGGERFVSFFAVLVALMSYSRSSKKSVDDYSRNMDTKVLIMDNPFGPISSEHLLRPLFEIAKKYRTQLICLTDLKQNSIMNCFNLIYMLKIIPNTLGTMEYLKIEEDYRKEEIIGNEESLEKVVYRASDFEQISLLNFEN